MTELGRIDSTGRSWSEPITVTLDNLHDICRRIHQIFDDKTYTVTSEHSLYGTKVRENQRLCPEDCAIAMQLAGGLKTIMVRLC